ncbi:MAG TPA: HEAT repeat domain-containing protein [Phycisphaerae bacterium]|nr:HEAT repeat domain-containing protein [Phycisphaerae bacterium]
MRFIQLASAIAVATIPLPAFADVASTERLTYQAIMDGLHQKSGEELFAFLERVIVGTRNAQISIEQIDSIITQMRRIQQHDDYQRLVDGKKGSRRVLQPNRGAARRAIFRLQIAKVAKQLARLPMEHRVSELVNRIQHPPVIEGYGSDVQFAAELAALGTEAVPFIVLHKPAAPYPRRLIVGALAKIGDPRGLDYIIEVLQDPRDSYRLERPEAAIALGSFDEKRAVSALIESLKDVTVQTIGRNSHAQQPSPTTQKPHYAVYYEVQHRASQSLTKITGYNWGPLYNEDYKTWHNWDEGGQQKNFRPNEVPRSDAELNDLVEKLFHRYMSARPNPWQPYNALAKDGGVPSWEGGQQYEWLVADLRAVGPCVVPLLTDQYEARVAATPVWEEKLRTWVGQILRDLDWPQSLQAAQSLDQSAE